LNYSSFQNKHGTPAHTTDLLVAKLDGIKFTKNARSRAHAQKVAELSYTYGLLLQEHAALVLEDLRNVCDVYGVLVIPAGMEPYVVGKALQADEALVKRLLLPSFDERDEESYATVAKALGYPVIGLNTKRTGSVSVGVYISDGKSVNLMTSSFDDSVSSRKTVRDITDHTCSVARNTLVGLKLGSSGGIIRGVDCTII